MARLKATGKLGGAGIQLGAIRLHGSSRMFREGLRGEVSQARPGGHGAFREICLAAAARGSDARHCLSVVLPGGVRIEGLDVAAAAELARLLL